MIRRIHKPGKHAADPLAGLVEARIGGKACIVEYEPDSELRDTEQVPLLEDGGIEGFMRREVLPHAADAWFEEEKTEIGYEISFTRYFLQAEADPDTRRDPRGHICVGARDRGASCRHRRASGVTAGSTIGGLRPYPEMRDSGVAWLGDVPGHWRLKKLRSCGAIVGGMTPNMDNRTY